MTNQPAATWLDQIVTNLKSSGESDALTFVEGNYLLLGSLGLDATSIVLTLFSKGHGSAAQVVLDSRMTDAQIEAQLQSITATETSVATARAAFYADLEKLAMAILPAVAKVALSAVVI
jgi:hypothetical protein